MATSVDAETETASRLGVPEGVPLEEADCLFCPPGTAATLVFGDPPFAVVRCGGCGLVYVSPRIAADRIAEVYGERYWRSPAARDYGYTDYRDDAERWIRTYRRRLAALRGRIPPAGRVLDVGCAAGFFLEAMAEAGYEVLGLEISSSIAEDARDRLGQERVHIGTLQHAPYPEAYFDLVTFWDVVEHLPDPIGALRRARALLKPGGRLVVETQNVESGFARLMGRRWQHFKQAEHLWHFSPSTVVRLLEEGHFAAVELTRRGAGKYVSPAFVAERAARLHPALSVALSPLARLNGAAYVNLRDEMIVIARPV